MDFFVVFIKLINIFLKIKFLIFAVIIFICNNYKYLYLLQCLILKKTSLLPVNITIMVIVIIVLSISTQSKQ